MRWTRWKFRLIGRVLASLCPLSSSEFEGGVVDVDFEDSRCRVYKSGRSGTSGGGDKL